MEGNSILEISRGEILECIDGQMQAIWENILDTETEATVTRKLTVTILLTPDRYWRKETLTQAQKEKLGVDEWTSCDVDRVAMDAANLLDRFAEEME